MLHLVTKASCLVALFSATTANVLPLHSRGYRYLNTTINSPHSRGGWRDGCDIDTDMDQNWPGHHSPPGSYGRTVKYNLEVSERVLAPDGVERKMMVFNGQYPGPLIEANWGDTVQITVTNNLKNHNGTGIHWHGLRQLGSCQMDGTNGLTECPIAPATSKTYTFRATQYGTSWYHSHFSAQYAEGLVGPIVIHGPTTANYDIDLGPYVMTDWFYTPFFTVDAAAAHAAGPPTGDTVLLNGKMVSSSGGSYEKTVLKPGKKHLLRLVNTGINQYFHVGLDGHKFTVVAADFVPIVPYETDSVVLGVGQRYDVIIHADQPKGNYWLRVGTGGGLCDGPNAQAENIRGIFSYVGAEEGEPTSEGTLPSGCYDEVIIPYVKSTVPKGDIEELELTFNGTGANGPLVQWFINDSQMKINWERPTLQYVVDGTEEFPMSDNVYLVDSDWTYWFIQADTKQPPLPHPIHLHGHDFYVLGHGNGTWDGNADSLNYDNPIRRDTATLPAQGWLALAFEADNPGAWLMHCHIPFHISQGLGLQFLERRSEILGSIGDLGDFKNGCKAWKQYKLDNNIAENDSGL
ncbi:multicopper oxidase [Patellaria atrata CBS 101060]|uniref:Multicopper oxidase n=1 Tax=Patellaria atrata CBS 101060 TaxID=1346257 RepID=A0A9P4SF93_9PEZI|nr:multicopper oxidase [Patellaria atrata CBS 101060]